MKRWFLFLLAGGLFCTVGCTASVKVIYPSRSYVTEKRHLGDVKTIMLVSSVDVEYYQTKGKPYAEIFASDNVLPEVLVEESGGTLTVGYKRSVSFRGENRCKVKVYAPSATVFETNASGDISIPGGLHTNLLQLQQTQSLTKLQQLHQPRAETRKPVLYRKRCGAGWNKYRTLLLLR